MSRIARACASRSSRSDAAYCAPVAALSVEERSRNSGQRTQGSRDSRDACVNVGTRCIKLRNTHKVSIQHDGSDRTCVCSASARALSSLRRCVSVYVRMIDRSHMHASQHQHSYHHLRRQCGSQHGVIARLCELALPNTVLLHVHVVTHCAWQYRRHKRHIITNTTMT
jgi:hypothetical protein